MATLGEALETELDALLGTYTPPVTVPRGFVSPKPQASYLVGKLGAAPAAAALGVTVRTLRKWLNGHPPTKANKAKLSQAYQDAYRQARTDQARHTTQRRLIKALTSPPDTRVQVAGTIQISNAPPEWRDNYGTNPAIPVKWWRKIVDAWRTRKGAGKLGELFEKALNEAAPAGAWVHWPDEADDAEVFILLTLAEG